jgi:predicted MPP superfamily phosphohydrolase
MAGDQALPIGSSRNCWAKTGDRVPDGFSASPTTASVKPMEPSRRSGWLRRWLVCLNAGLLLVAGALAGGAGTHALFLAALVPLAFVPFSLARLRLYRSIEPALERLGGGAALAVVAAGIALDAVMIAQLLTARSSAAVPVVRAPGISWVGPVWFSAHALLSVGYGAVGLARACGRLLRRVRRLLPGAVEEDVSLERRRFLRQFGVAGAALPFAVSLSGIGLSYDFRVEEKEIELPHWPAALDGLRVAHLSDIHVGGDMNHERLRRVAALTMAHRPDLVLHTGDFLTHRRGDFDAPLYEALAAIRAPLGQWACFGNHDFDDPGRLERRLSEVGVVVLRNALRTIAARGHALEIAGIDFLFRRSNRAALYARIVDAWGPRGGAPRLLLNHDPRGFADLPQSCADLVLSGHTHGGHIGIQLGSSHAVTVVGLAGIPDQGVFRRGDMRLFVTRCIGFYGYPMRIGIPPEIAILTLRTPRPRDARSRA